MSSLSGRAWAVVAGGGTGGHVYPGVALAKELVRRGHEATSVHFVGARRGVEAKSQALAGFAVTLLPGRGLVRQLSVKGVARNLGALAGACAATAKAIALFSRWRPAVVVSFGGYASLPCVAAAALHRVPVVVVDLDAVPGLVNRWAARLPGSSVYSGVPVRPEMAQVDRTPSARRRAKERLGLPAEAVVVAVSGGSLGSARLNQAAVRLAELWADRQGVAVYHVVGQRDWEGFVQRSPRAPKAGALCYRAVPYQEDMPSLYSAADVAVQRAGASSVAELALAGVPSVLVPLPGAPGGHQEANARAMAEAGAAVVVADSELDGERLAKELEAVLADPVRLEAMAAAAKSLARPNASQELADVVERSALRPPARAREEVVAGAG
jgi:UDP-N-acetylglucosamine--N-acetylmuramyl-(pentapeptide) pyrophosphoryl-undecaprenol N-acetylglucosamine transferase